MELNKKEELMYYFIKKFPQVLGRTQIIKAIYLLDCEWFKSFGETYSGLEYKRDYNGPFDVDFYEGIDELIANGFILEHKYNFNNGVGYEYHDINMDFSESGFNLNPVARYIADEIVEKLSNKDTQAFLDLAYKTEPMLEILNQECNEKFYGRKLDMGKLRKSPEPLFDFEEIKKIANNLDTSIRGSDDEYNRAIIKEMSELSVYKERVDKACQLIGEK
ncbi:hypothetical protein BLX87_23230 [Bacillus sp. VT-16-64]|nr:hypothetical protein BLX87_23230 [Bacillus sp. VT-16-64]